MTSEEIKAKHAALVTGERLRDMVARCRPGTGPRMVLVMRHDDSGGIVEQFRGDLLDRLLAVIDAEGARLIAEALS